MNTESQKQELIQWIKLLDDKAAIEELFIIKRKKTTKHKKRTFGCGKNIFSYVAPDFNEPSSEFNEYIP